MHVGELEQLSARLQQLQQQLQQAPDTQDTVLPDWNPLVQAARDCQFMLPKTLTVRTLAETVERKIATVHVLLERARRHESLPEVAQVAAEQEYTLTVDDFRHEHPERQ